jgi:anti-sigma regulatory factor (Ser/Thr protein kinase)
LAVSELATNAIFYGGSDDFVVSIDAVSLLEISVEDGSTAIPVQRSPQIDSPRGRGLAIVDSVSDGWGFELTDGGKRVWCRFALDHADAGPAPGFEDAGLTSAPGG